MIRVSAFRSVPPFAQGLVRDLRVRWALEEAGLAYEERLLDRADQSSAGYRALQPFGQVPSFEEDGLVLFESGAIVLHIAQRSPALMPPDESARARVQSWMFAALNSIEPQIQHLVEVDIFNAGAAWTIERRPAVVEMITRRLADLAHYLDGRDFLVDRFSAADVLMTTVLHIARHTELVTGHPMLNAYKDRCEARPAYRKALADQMRHFATAA